MKSDAMMYLPSMPRWTRSKLHTILRDRAYIGEVFYQGNWYPGTHKPLVDRVTFDRVQVLLGEKTYKSHNMTYAGELIHLCPLRQGHHGRDEPPARGTSTTAA
jgi:hypothetical protein